MNKSLSGLQKNTEDLYWFLVILFLSTTNISRTNEFCTTLYIQTQIQTRSDEPILGLTRGELLLQKVHHAYAENFWSGQVIHSRITSLLRCVHLFLTEARVLVVACTVF